MDRRRVAIGGAAVLALGIAALSAARGQVPAGLMSRDDILKARPAWAAVLEAYRPRPDVLENIRQFDRPVALDVYFDLDSADSRDLVARLLGLQERLDLDRVKARYVAVDPKSLPEDIQARFVESIPTLIVLVDGSEMGRVVVSPQTSLEEDLDSFLAAYIDPQSIDFNDRESLRGTKHNTLPIPCYPCHLAGKAKPRSGGLWAGLTSSRSSSGTRPPHR